jgi:endoglucanase
MKDSIMAISMKSCAAAALLWLLSPGCGGNTPIRTVPDAATAKDSGSAPDVSTPDAGAPDAEEKTVLIDDFEDGDDKSVLAVSGSPGSWYEYDDKENGGASSIAFTGSADGKVAMNGPGYKSQKSLEVTGTFDQGKLTYQPYVGWGLYLAGKSAPADLSSYVGIGYTYKGAAHRIRVETFEVTDYDYFGMDLPASTDWKTVRIPFSQMMQEGWGKKVSLNVADSGNLDFYIRGKTGQAATVDIDDFVFITTAGPRTPDMEIRPPQPPADGVIDSVAVTNPLQQNAMKYLDKGCNITNWLEQDAFTGFTYDETYVANLAKAGFKSLRLPVDLDRYVESGGLDGGIGDGIDGGIDAGDRSQVSMKPELFTVLDAFVQWTQKYGLSLTIDYHQYDYSLDMSKPETLTKAVAAWGLVAAHFASNPREDLFYELLNEPDLSFNQDHIPTQAQWTALAQRMIDAIRAVDKTHTLIFGDTQWYAISTLSTRTPFADSNIIYSFHFYEPFIFTHQGAAWASMGSTHDIPYPYATDRWSQYFSDLGFLPSMPSWILSAARGYYTQGNKSWVRNQILEAKRWAVKNNVPVICNEFGVNDTSSRMEDRARYYTDIADIYGELQIPWQIWFTIMDKTTGAVAPEYSTALKLK